MTYLNSSCVRGVGYDPFSGDLELQFHSGRTYTHHRVPVSCYLGLITALSAGSYYNLHIRGRYH